MPFPIRTCVICSEEFELRPDKPGFANRCPSCSEPEEDESANASPLSTDNEELNATRRRAIRELLYRREE
jgi:hypothetical protein